MSKNPAKIKVIGVGGAGGNAVSQMMTFAWQDIELIAVNTDLQDLKKTNANLKIPIGQKITGGLGTGMNPALGRKAALESQSILSRALDNTEVLFITAGLGGGTGSGAAPVIAKLAKDKGILTVVVATLPFSFEGRPRQLIAKHARAAIKNYADALVVLPNDKILFLADGEISLKDAFLRCDEILRQAVQGISDLIMLPGIINVDFADIKSVLENSGRAYFGIGKARGSQRAEKAAKAALNFPLLEMPSRRAKGVLFTIAGGRDITLAEIEQVASLMTKEIDPQAKIIFGAVQDEKLKKGEIKVTVIATGF